MKSLNPKPPENPSAFILLGKYELGSRIGSGSFAKVHIARSISTGELVAIKIIDKTKTMNSGTEPRIIREIEAMRRLHHHPNILKIHEVMATKSKIYLVIEYAAGGEIFSKIIKFGRINESSARRYFQQLVSALCFCHGGGIAHRDVKPQNLLLDKEGNLKVSDFGLSALPEHRSSDGLLHTACGTPAYTAPEVIGQRGYDGVKADAWSCGVFLFFLLAGHVPFNDSNIVTMYRKIVKREYQLPSSISKPARSVIYKLLDPNPETRMSLETVIGTTWFRKNLQNSEFQSSMFESDGLWVRRFGREEKQNGFVSVPDVQIRESLEPLGNQEKESDRVFEKSSNGVAVTAFDLISLSSGLDLSGLVERRKRKEKRFMVRASGERVVEKVEKIGEKLGFRVEKKEEGRVVGLGKGRMVVVVEVVELMDELVLVDFKVAEGEEEEEEESNWTELILGFEEIVRSWHSDVI